jgi:hypothetical protein
MRVALFAGKGGAAQAGGRRPVCKLAFTPAA